MIDEYSGLIFTNNKNLTHSLNRYLHFCSDLGNAQKIIFNYYNSDNKKNTIYSLLLDNSNNENQFQDKHITLFPSFQISDKNEITNPLRILNINKARTIKDELERIIILIKIYLTFSKRAASYFTSEEEFELIWNNYTKKDDDSKKNIIMLNIQCGNFKYWNNILEKVFKEFPINTYFIFYWIGEVDKNHSDYLIKKDLEYNDIIWGYSKFLRDFLKSRNIGFELNIPLNYDFTINEEKLKSELLLIKNKILSNNKSKTDHKKVDYKSLIKDSLNLIYNNRENETTFFPTDSIFPVNEFASSLSKYYIFNKNKFADNLEKIQCEILSKSNKAEVSTHGILREKDELISNFKNTSEYFENLGNIDFWHLFRKNISALLNEVVNYKNYDKPPNFLFIDDNYKPIQNRIPVLSKWFPNSKFYYTTNFKWKDFLCFSEESLLNKNIGSIEEYFFNTTKKIANSSINNLNPNFLIIDLEYEGLLVGFEIIRKLRNEIDLKNKNIFVIVFSRYDDPYIIRKAINSGALLYVTKSNFLRIINKIFLLNFELDSEIRKYRNFENWHKLNRLEPSQIIELKNNKIYFPKYDVWDKNNFWDNNKFKYTQEYEWIRKLPKADLHCHIGSCIGPDLLPVTATIVLAEYYSKNFNRFQENLKEILEYLKPLILDPNLNEDGEKKEQSIESLKYKKEISYICSLSYNKNKFKILSIFEMVTDYLQQQDYKKATEEVILSPYDTTLERLWFKVGGDVPSILKKKISLRDKKINYAEVMLCFILLLFCRKTNGDKKEILEQITFKRLEIIKELLGESSKNLKENSIKSFINFFFKQINKVFNDYDFSSNDDKGDILKFLQSANSHKRCAKKNSGTLFNYLRGCEYGGAEHLQTQTSIYVVTHYIVNEIMKKQNIKYLGLRCAVDGYASLGLQTQEEAMEALLRGFDYFTNKKKEKYHVDIVLTAKRHKSEKEFENNVRLALKYRYGLSLNRKDYKIEGLSFFDSPTRVVSFDLAGLEKGNRPSKFYQQFLPLLRECFPITVHAGEEDDYEAIWEAIYLIHSQRIGHALTLRDNQELLEFVRERHITIELCPFSNYLTRNRDKENFIFRDDEKIEEYINDKQTYPLRQYLNENLDVTINSDNPFVNDADLIQEYLFAAQLVGGLSKWEILRIIKNGFRGTTIPKNDKRKLMNEIENEIYEILLNEKKL